MVRRHRCRCVYCVGFAACDRLILYLGRNNQMVIGALLVMFLVCAVYITACVFFNLWCALDFVEKQNNAR